MPIAAPRRRFQFSLRTLMLVVTLVAILCPVVFWAAKKWLKPEQPQYNGLYLNSDSGVIGPVQLDDSLAKTGASGNSVEPLSGLKRLPSGNSPGLMH